MRTGAIFARGSCRALKWMALVGVVFSLGAGQAVAQGVYLDPDYSSNGIMVTGLEYPPGGTRKTVAEEGSTTIGVSMRATVLPSTATATTVTVTVALSAIPAAAADDVTTAREEGDAILNPGTGQIVLTFPANTNNETPMRGVMRSGSVVLQTAHDDDAENEDLMVSFTITDSFTDAEGGDVDAPIETSRNVRIADNETQTYVLTAVPGKALVEGGTVDATLRAVPPHEDLSRSFTLHVDNALYVLQQVVAGTASDLSTIELGNADITDTATATVNSATIRLQAPANDKNRVEDTVTVTVASLPKGTLGGKVEGSLEFKAADIHVLPMITAIVTDKDGEAISPAPASVNEGEDVYLTVTAQRPEPAAGQVAVSGEKLTVTLEPTGSAGAGDFRFVSAHPFTIDAAPQFGEKSKSKTKFKIEILDDPDVGDEMLVFDAVAKGSASNGSETSTSEGVITLTIVDQTALNISPKSDADVMAAYMAAREEAAGDDDLWTAAGEPDPAIMIELEDLFDLPMSGFNVSADAMSSDGMVVMADANSDNVTLTPMGDGEAMVTVTATTTASTVGTQVSANIATVELMVMVDELPPVIMVMTDPMDMVEEGGTITVTATLNQKAPYDKKIMLTVVGPVEGDDHMVTIMEGEMMGQAMLMVMDDNEVKPMSDIVIVATHAAIEGGSVEMMLSVTENDTEMTYELSGPEDMNLVEGMEYEITATASAAVMEDTEVMLMRDRAASDAGDDDYMVESIMIMAGETMGTTMLMVTEDGMDDGGAGMPEKLVLFGMVGNVQTNDLAFYIWDAAVPALPIIAQLLLAAFLAVGGYRRYLKR